MKDARGKIIYVGKAVSLKARVRSYFQSPASLSPRVRLMVEKVSDIEYVVTGSEVEALILENNLIKRHRPWYNIRLRDDKTYPYVKVTLAERFPRVITTRRMVQDGSRYFGPYTDAGALYDTLRFLKRLFPVRSCNRKIGDKTDDRPCLNYHIERCLAPCSGRVSEEAYRTVIDQICLFLEGRQEELIRAMRRDMTNAALVQDYERAAVIRDRIRDMEKVMERQKIVSPSLGDIDVIAFARNDTDACAQILLIRDGKMIGREHFVLENVGRGSGSNTGGEGGEADTGDPSDSDIMTAFVNQYYSSASFVPSEVLLQHPIEDEDVVAKWLSERKGSKVALRVPKRGEKKELVEMAAENARLSLGRVALERVERGEAEDMEEGALRDLQEAVGAEIGLDGPPRRIEAFDISNIQGHEAVGSMVVFEGGRPLKSDYRRFKIKLAEGPDDYAMMREVVLRRYRRARAARDGDGPGAGIGDAGKWGRLPDLILIDGGKGQLGAARDALREVGLDFIPTIGLAKEFEHIFVEGRSDPIILPRDSKALFVLQRVRDEAHRFALAYHRRLREKDATLSRLAEIKGIGRKRIGALFNVFKSLDEMRRAGVDELASVPGMTRKAAELVYSYLHQDGLAQNV